MWEQCPSYDQIVYRAEFISLSPFFSYYHILLFPWLYRDLCCHFPLSNLSLPSPFSSHGVVRSLVRFATGRRMHLCSLARYRWSVHIALEIVMLMCFPFILIFISLLSIGFHSIRHFSIPFLRKAASPSWCWSSSVPLYNTVSPVLVLYLPDPVHLLSLIPRMCRL